MLPIIRALGLLNAAVWFGAAVFFTAVAGPAIFSPEVANFLPRPQAGRLALALIDRYFLLHYVCGGIALVHLIAEWLASGRPLPRFRLALILGLLAVALAGGFGIQPGMRAQHRKAYDPKTPAAEQAIALKEFRRTHGLTQAANLGLMAGMLIHLLMIPATGLPRAGLRKGVD
jgi:hypothetical protein